MASQPLGLESSSHEETAGSQVDMSHCKWDRLPCGQICQRVTARTHRIGQANPGTMLAMGSCTCGWSWASREGPLLEIATYEHKMTDSKEIRHLLIEVYGLAAWTMAGKTALPA
jgi:hypothetical protein